MSSINSITASDVDIALRKHELCYGIPAAVHRQETFRVGPSTLGNSINLIAARQCTSAVIKVQFLRDIQDAINLKLHRFLAMLPSIEKLVKTVFCSSLRDGYKSVTLCHLPIYTMRRHYHRRPVCGAVARWQTAGFSVEHRGSVRIHLLRVRFAIGSSVHLYRDRVLRIFVSR